MTAKVLMSATDCDVTFELVHLTECDDYEVRLLQRSEEFKAYIVPDFAHACLLFAQTCLNELCCSTDDAGERTALERATGVSYNVRTRV